MSDSIPSETMRRKVHELCRLIEKRADEKLTLEAMSREIDVSPYHLQRMFKEVTGVTPRQYAETCRMRLLKEGLKQGRNATEAIYDAGFGSSSRVYERADSHLGMTPNQYRRGGAGVDISYATASTRLGCLLMAATDRGLCEVMLADDETEFSAYLLQQYPSARITAMPPDAPGFSDWMRALDDHLDGVVSAELPPLDLRGTVFQVCVWNYLRTIPRGTVRTYTDVAKALERPDAVRAVANACASNRIALLVPCHRVIRSDGGLGGYRWGLERKEKLLEWEQSAQ